MKKRVLCLVLAMVLSLSVTATALAATVTPMMASGRSSMSANGRNVSFAGYSISAQTEDIIRITVILWEQRGSTWYEVSRASNELQNDDYVSTTGLKTVTGNHYYKVTGIHYSQTNGQSYTVTSETSSTWIP